MDEQFISVVHLKEVLDNVLEGNEYNDSPQLSVNMIKNGLIWQFTQHGCDIPCKMLGYIVGVRQTVRDICIKRLRIKRLCAKISTLKQAKKIVFFTTVIYITCEDLSENSVNKNV